MHPRTLFRTPAGLVMSLFAGLSACDSGADQTFPTEASSRQSRPAVESSVILDDVELRPGATADIHVRIYRHGTQPCADPGRAALLVHGINATAASWEPLVEALLNGDPARRLCRIAAVDQAGHGSSSLPVGVSFGELMVEDYARTLLAVLERLPALQIRPSILVGHSQGAGTIQAAQQMMLDAGTTLRTAFGIRDVVMLGVQGPRELRAAHLLPPGQVAAVIGAYLTTTPERGTYVQGPPQLFQQLWFLTTALTYSMRTPSPQTIGSRGWNADAPLFATLQAAGLSGFDMPSIEPGIFAPRLGTTLFIVDFADDPWSLSDRAAEIYVYLTGDASLAGFSTLTDPLGEAVHDYMITHPAEVRSGIPLPRSGSLHAANP